VHEAQYSLDDAYYGNRFPAGYLAASHTSAEQVGEVAAAANARRVILSHYEPTDLPDAQWQEAIGRNYSGPLTIARDGQVFGL
jgi:ribonuclease BN (tRNA processing enzyme)